MEFKIRAYRFNPDTDEKHYYKEYTVEDYPGMTVLNALIKVKSELDGTLSFRRSCRSAICGSCAMKINGISKLACKTQVSPEIEKFGIINVEPLANMPVIRDLIVEQESFFDKIKEIKPYLLGQREDEAHNSFHALKEGEKISQPVYYKYEFQNLTGNNDTPNCILCECCYSECGGVAGNPRYLGPAALAKLYRYSEDPRDNDKNGSRLVNGSKPDGMWDCVHCQSCEEFCPKGISPVKSIVKLHERTIKNSITFSAGSKHVVSIAKSIGETGRLDEIKVAFDSGGISGLINDLPMAFGAGLKGKIPPLRLKLIKDMDDIRLAYKELDLEEK
ncbi:MAG: 2Fe-2S iron-sulfur cluster-binding protein [Deltaproteobacteria bacterium]|jgi:succinate dehydrogenase / fumarate reductase iron-sulfur subunit|nr:2Fe-2S iron-sulfur cluster-binding protein [Deltaproteobacteria bacterium]